VSVVDRSGVEVVANVSVGVASGLNLSLSLGSPEPSAGAGVTVRAAIAGGLPPYSYRLALSDGETSDGNASSAGDVAWTVEPVAAGYVTLRGSVTDAAGRSSNVSFTFYVAAGGPAAPALPGGGPSPSSAWALGGALAGAALTIVGGFVVRRWVRWPRRAAPPPAESAGRTVVRELLAGAEDGIDRSTLELLAEERRVTSDELASGLDSWRRAGRVRIEDDGTGREVVRWVTSAPRPEPASDSPPEAGSGGVP
jgi:hypothetical protein